MSVLANLSNADEIDYYEEALQRYLDLEIDADRFTAIRLQQGTYGQRQEGVHMMRVKLPGGRLTPAKLDTIAGVMSYTEHPYAHITTRQDIQLHYVPLASTPAVMRDLAKGGLTTREACGNTVRNITTCPLAGVCPREHTDVSTHLEATVAHFLRNPLNQQMPRKFKISLSGCEADCAQSMIHDLGVVAIHEEGRFGFKLVAGGGLGHKPHEAITVLPFLEEEDLLPAMEAVITLHNKYSDRTKRAKSRIKFLVDRFGAEGFVEKFHEEFARTRAALGGRQGPQGNWRPGVASEIPGSGAPRKVFHQKQPGRSVVPVSPALGQLTAPQLRGLARLAREFGVDDIRTTQDQNLMLLGVSDRSVSRVIDAVKALGLSTPVAGDNVVACPGASTCRLGITSSMNAAPKLCGGEHDLRIRVSGCHNGCAQPESGDIGIYGEGRRMFKRLIPHYQIYLGGDGMGGGGLALKGPSVPAARIEQALARIEGDYSRDREGGESFFKWVRRKGVAHFDALLADLIRVEEADAPQLSRDHGDTTDFRVVSLGGGECAGATQVAIGRYFFDAAHERTYRDAFVFQRKYAEAAACA